MCSLYLYPWIVERACILEFDWKFHKKGPDGNQDIT